MHIASARLVDAPSLAKPGCASEGKQPIILTFPAPLSKDATVPLRVAGFRFNKVLQHWEGLARLEDAAALAKAHGGSARGVVPAVPPAGPTSPATD
jgi:hypothetical protein